MLPKTRKLWFKVATSAAAKRLRKGGSCRPRPNTNLIFAKLRSSPGLSDETDVAAARVLKLTAPKRVFQGRILFMMDSNLN